jgi:hypothetical protein
MATFNNKGWIKHDDYMTPKHAWADIAKYIPKDKIIWEAFYGSGSSGRYLTELGFNVIHDATLDFFIENRGQIIVSNPPFSLIPKILKRMILLDKPFILLMPSSKINTQYFREALKGKIQIIIPKKRIHFEKLINGVKPDGWRDACNFDCFYYCYKIDLPDSIVWLD